MERKTDVLYNRMKVMLLAVATVLLSVSCKDEPSSSTGHTVRKEYSVVVVLPLDNGMETTWRRSIDWAMENLNNVLLPECGIRIKADWYDEETEDMEALFDRLASDRNIYAIIGPLYSSDAVIAAKHCVRTGKTLIPPLATSEEMMRAYTGNGFLWCLAENDISQCEVLLARALHKGAKSVSLLAGEGSYGKTFIDWFPFQAKELGLTVDCVETYNDSNLEEKMNSFLGYGSDCLICIPDDIYKTDRMNAVYHNAKGCNTFLLYSDGAFLKTLSESDEGMEGIVQTYDPQTGFHVLYETRYGIQPEYGSAHFYDAVLLAGLGIMLADMNGSTDLNEALRELVDMDGDEIIGCSQEGILQLVRSISEGGRPHVTGASGKLRFNSEVYTNVLHSVYCHWTVYQGKHLILEYNTSDADNRTETSVTNWNWKVKYHQEFSNASVPMDYAPVSGLYAIIVATSFGWANYRHQANAWGLYRLLSENGLKDDDILFIAENDLVSASQNPYPGEVRLNDDGVNLYEPDGIDYILSDCSWDKFCNTVREIPTDSTTNLLVYWVGHGIPDAVYWGESLVDISQVAGLFTELATLKHFRKTLLLPETCYSGSIGLACEGIPGLLAITSSNEQETSKAESYSPMFGTWLSNSFSNNLLIQLQNYPDATFYELYNRLYEKTIGSHVSVYNADSFDNLYNSPVGEFFRHSSAYSSLTVESVPVTNSEAYKLTDKVDFASMGRSDVR